jgi:hypothetical protein
MARNRIMRGGRAHRRLLHGAAISIVMATALAFAGCGRGGDDPPSETEKADDIAILNTALGYELTTVDAYTRALPLIRGAFLPVIREFRAMQQEHVNAITKAIRGLGGRTDAEPADLDFTGVKTRADFLAFAYDQVSAAIAEDMSAVARLNAPWPRSLLASIAANEAQQLTVLRQLLGADPVTSVPDAFARRDAAPVGVRREPAAESAGGN